MPYDPRLDGAECDRCPLGGRIAVPPEPARQKLHLIVIGEGPGRSEERWGRPFHGPSGKLLDAALKEAGTHRANCHVTNVILCRPDDDGNGKNLDAPIACCAPRLAAELAALPKDVPILSLGAGAARFTIGKSGVQKYRGFVWSAPEIKLTQIRNIERAYEKAVATPPLPTRAKAKAKAAKARAKAKAKAAKRHTLAFVEKRLNALTLLKARATIAGRIIVPTVHPAFILRGADTWLPILRIDINRVVRIARRQLTLEQLTDVGPFQRVTTVTEAKKALVGFSNEVVVDLETDAPDPMRAKITCVGICDINDVTKIVVLDRKSEDAPWPRGYAALLRRFLRKRTVVGHNMISFDQPILENHYGIKLEKVFDTLVAHRSYASHMPQSLAHVGSVYTDVGPWKQKFKSSEEKGAVAGFGVKFADLATYNAADVRVNALALRKMQPDIAREQAICDEDMQMAQLYRQMSATGVKMDVARRDQLAQKLKRRAAALLGEMRLLVRKQSFSPSKPNDIRRALYKQFRAPLWLAPATPTGLPSTAALVLEALRDEETRAGKLADLIIRWRSANDSRSEYLEVYLHTDGRVHTSWKQVETGRPATRNPNLLNLPRMAHCTGCGVLLLDGCSHGDKCKKHEEPQPEEQLRDVYVAESGYEWVYFDLSQAEMRFAAHCSGDPVFMESCAKDIHTENACILFPDAVELIRSDPKGKGAKFRNIAKTCGFAVAYGAEAAKIFATLRQKNFDVDIDDVEMMLNNLKSSYKVFYNWANKNVDFANRHGYIPIPFSNRKRWVGFHAKPNLGYNTPIQGGVAAVMNKKLLEMERRKTKGARLIIYHYDAAIYETPKSEVADMKRLITDMWQEPIVVPHNGISFMQKIDLKVGERWSDF